jgi:CDGSH-type Zn-finger protein
MAKISATPNGPYLLEGQADVHRPGGGNLAQENKVWLCRCGGSKNKPFCDGTHRKIGFKSG